MCIRDSTELKPGETVVAGGTTVTNNGDAIVIEKGGTTATVTPAGDSVQVGGDGSVAIPDGSKAVITSGEGGSTTNVTVPEGGEDVDKRQKQHR